MILKFEGSEFMRKKMNVVIISICVCLLSQAGFSQGIIKDNEAIWQKKPGSVNLNWESQVFHLGNGYFGASSHGGAKQEIITLSEKTFWTGGPGDHPYYNLLTLFNCQYLICSLPDNPDGWVLQESSP